MTTKHEQEALEKIVKEIGVELKKIEKLLSAILPKKALTNLEALEELADLENMDYMEFLEALSADVNFLSNAMCTQCGTESRVEPDCDDGYCYKCGSYSVKHAFMLAPIRFASYKLNVYKVDESE